MSFTAGIFILTLGVALGAAPALAAGKQPLSASKQLGQTKENYKCGARYEWIQTAALGTSYAAPSSGTLAAWSTRAGIAGTMQFEVWRQVGSGKFVLVYISPAHKLRANSLNTVALRPAVKVKKGYLLGYRSMTPVSCTLETGSSKDVYDYNSSGLVPTPGRKVTFKGPETGYRFDIAATFVQ